MAALAAETDIDDSIKQKRIRVSLNKVKLHAVSAQLAPFDVNIADSFDGSWVHLSDAAVLPPFNTYTSYLLSTH